MNMETGRVFLDREREDAREFIEIVIKVPKERRKDVENLVNGFCLGVKACESSNQDKKNPVAV